MNEQTEPGSSAASRIPWHTLSIEQLAGELAADLAQGLSPEEAERRLLRHGPNAIREAPRRHWSVLLLNQFKDFMILVLLAAAVLAGATGDMEDVAVILAIVILNAVIGFVQEYRAEAAVQALRRMAAPVATVRRAGKVLVIDAAGLVPGDLVLLEAGCVVPADLRLVEAAELASQEAALTGESQAVEKRTTALDDLALPLADQRNMLFKGTIVVRGRGRGMVVATGMDTEIGRIATLISSAEAGRTPLQLRLAAFGRRLSLVVLGICLLVFAAGLLRGEDPLLMLLTAISLAVAAIPEALPAVVTISLALGARKMVRQRALVRRLPAVETLGSVTYICSDKTGTITENRMRARVWFVDGVSCNEPPARLEGSWAMLRELLAVSNDVEQGPEGLVGDPTEVALVEAAAAMGLSKHEALAQLPRVAELPFDSLRQRMATAHSRAGDTERCCFVKGAPEAVLPLCKLAAEDAAAIGAAAERMAASGRRMLAMGRRTLRPGQGCLEEDLEFLGLVGLEDPPRAEAAAAVATCRAAGVTPVMITGDHPATARSIAVEVGLLPAGGKVVTGRALDAMDDAALVSLFDAPVAFARVSPEHKIRIVDMLKQRGEFVAMTGDGVNDAPALKRADIGVAMGRSGTDVAREAADMVLLDDNFATIVSAIREGRRMYDNVRKFVKYTMTSNSAEILTILLAPFLGLPLPLLPLHILWINLVTDGLPGLALSLERAERGVMQRPPRRPGESVFAAGMWQHMVWVGGLMAGVALLGQAWSWAGDSASWQTLVFTTLVVAQLAHVMAIRSERESIFALGVLSNAPLAWIVGGSVALQMAIVYTDLGNELFNTRPLSAAELAAAFASALIVFAAVECEKVLIRRGALYGLPAASARG